jgi:hypothetical protein
MCAFRYTKRRKKPSNAESEIFTEQASLETHTIEPTVEQKTTTVPIPRTAEVMSLETRMLVCEKIEDEELSAEKTLVVNTQKHQRFIKCKMRNIVVIIGASETLHLLDCDLLACKIVVGPKAVLTLERCTASRCSFVVGYDALCIIDSSSLDHSCPPHIDADLPHLIKAVGGNIVFRGKVKLVNDDICVFVKTAKCDASQCTLCGHTTREVFYLHSTSNLLLDENKQPSRMAHGHAFVKFGKETYTLDDLYDCRISYQNNDVNKPKPKHNFITLV